MTVWQDEIVTYFWQCDKCNKSAEFDDYRDSKEDGDKHECN